MAWSSTSTSNSSYNYSGDTIDRSKQVVAKTKDSTEVEKVKAYKEQKEYLSSIKQLKEDIAATSIEILENAKNVGTADFKTLSTKQKILDVQGDIEDLELKIAGAIDDGNDSLVEAYKNRRQALRNAKAQLLLEEKKIKVYETQNNLIKKQLEKINKLADVVKNPLKALDHFGDHLKEKFVKNFKLAMADSNASVMNLVTSGLKVGLIGALMMGVHRALHLNEEIVEMRRNFGLSAEEAHNMHSEIESATISSKILGATHKDYAAAVNTLADSYGTAVASNTKLLDSQVLLTKHIGLTNAEAMDFNNISMASGTTAQENLAHIRDTVTTYNQLTGDSMDVRSVQRDIAKTSLKTLATYRGNVKELARAVIQAKRLGMSVDDVAKSTDSLLDFESSLENEMKARVLTGKSLNFDKARALKLAGKESEAMDEMLRQAGTYDEFLNSGPLAQKAMADAMGMTVDQLTKALQLSERDRKVGKKRLADLTEGDKKKLIAAKLYTEESLKDAEAAEQSATAKEKLAKIADKLLMTFDKLVSGPLEHFIELIDQGYDMLSSVVSKVKEIMPPALGNVIKAVAKGGLGVAALVGAIEVGKKIFEFFKQDKLGTKGNPTYTKIVGGGGGGAGGGEGEEEEEDTGSRIKRGLKGAKRLFKAFKKGGFKGGMKAAGRMMKSSLGMSGGDSSPSSGARKPGGKMPGTSSATPSAPSAGKKGFFGKIGGFFSKVGEKIGNLSPMKHIKKLFSDKGVLKKLLKKLPKIGSIVTMVSTLLSLRGSAAGAGGEGGPTHRDVGNEVARTLGDLGGSVVGGLLGSIVPGAGNILGSVLGGMGGSALAGLITKNADMTELGKTTVDVLKPEGAATDKKPIDAKDALIRPGMPPITFDKGDMIMALPDMLGGGGAKSSGGSSNVEALLKELIAKVDQPTVVQFGNKTIETFDKQATIRKSFTSQIDRGYGATS